jgi:hypothetical protein
MSLSFDRLRFDDDDDDDRDDDILGTWARRPKNRGSILYSGKGLFICPKRSDRL